MTSNPLSVLMAALLAGAMSGCSQLQPAATSTPAPAVATSTSKSPASNPDVYRFRIGTLDAVALKDGDIDAPNDGRTFGVGQPTEQVAALLSAA